MGCPARGLLVNEMLIGIGEVGWSRLQANLVGRPGQVADHQLMLRISRVQQRLELAELLRSFEQRIADERNVVAVVQSQWQLGRHRLRGVRTRRGLLVDAVLSEVFA